MSTLVFGIPSRDPLPFAALPLLLAAVAGVAAFVPARRAASVDRRGLRAGYNCACL
jgi:hypothetical protein